MSPAAFRPADRSPASRFVTSVDGAGDGPAAREAYRAAFRQLRAEVPMHPASGRPSAVFESATAIATSVAASCLPLAIAVAMHLYPLCVLQCIPLPLFSVARLQRALLLRTIRNRSLILANAGSERTRGPQDCLTAREDARGLLIDGACEYMSLASVADVVLFKARTANGRRAFLCAADLHGESVRIGDWKFAGRMRLSDTCPVTFVSHRVPRGRYAAVAADEVLQCTSDYQRSWFHLFIADAHLARIERLHDVWGLRRSPDRAVSLNELAQLRAYALRLLDDFSTGSDVRPLTNVTTAIKLRVSLMAQATTIALRGHGAVTAGNADRMRDASELEYIRFQPTADDRILRSLGVPAAPASLTIRA
jgi:hypothetical protein